MKIDILICTYNQGINEVEKILMTTHPQISYKVSHQVTDSSYSTIPSNLINRNDVSITQIHSKGLSKNRNHVLSMATGDICLIADDDVRYSIDEVLSVVNYFERNRNTDILIGKIRTYKGEPEYKPYPKNSKRIGYLDIGKISSIEIAFRLDSVRKHKIQFDERFGIGGVLYSKGEETIFMGDCLSAGLKIHYEPIYIVKHPFMSSCSNIIYDEQQAKYVGALNWRIFKKIAYLNSLVFSVKYYRRYKATIDSKNFFRSYLKGVKEISTSLEG